MTRQSSAFSIEKALRFVTEALCTVHAQKLPCFQKACPREVMSHVKGPFVLDFQTPNSLVRPINFYFKYFRAKICHFNLLRNHHSFLRQGVNNIWQFKKELFAPVAAPAKPLDSQTNDLSILNALRLYFRWRKKIYILKFNLVQATYSVLPTENSVSSNLLLYLKLWFLWAKSCSFLSNFLLSA